MSSFCKCWNGVTSVDGLRIYSDSLDRRIYSWLHAKHWLGSQDVRILKAFLKPGAIAVDAGANIGLYSAIMGRLVQDGGRIISFEPVPRLYSCLERNVRDNGLGMVETYNVALGHAEGTCQMILSAYNSGDNRLAFGSRGISVRMVQGDDIVGHRMVDFIKIDVQGFELPALKGLEKCILRSRDITLFFEYWPSGMRCAGYEANELRDWLASHSFKLKIMTPAGEWMPIGWADISRYCAWSPWGAYGTFVACRG